MNELEMKRSINLLKNDLIIYGKRIGKIRLNVYFRTLGNVS